MRRPKLIVYWCLFFIALSSLFRLGFFLSFINQNKSLELSEIFTAFILGAKFDFRLAILILLPLLVLMLIPKIGLSKKNVLSALSKAYLILVSSLLVLFYALNIGHYDYLSEVVNVSIFRFVDDISISAQMLWQTYPVIGIGAFLMAVIAVNAYLISLIFKYTIEQKARKYGRLSKTIMIALLCVFLISGIFGRFSKYPLRWSNALFSSSDLLNATAVNPVLYFYRTLKNIDQGYTLEQVKTYYPYVRDYLDLPKKQVTDDNYNLQRSVKPDTQLTLSQPNIVFVFLESMANHYLGAAGNTLSPTPFIDGLIKQSIYFPQHYVPYESTAKSTWSVLTGIPDPTIIKTATRNPRIAKQHSLLADLDDYERYYFLGGSANWANIRGFLTQSLPNLNLFEEGDYDEYPVINVWGVSDLSLFDKAHKILTHRDSKKPFIAFIQTAQNHPPFTFPEGEGFEVDPISMKQANKAGFTNPGRYNAVRLIDHTLKKYMALVEKSDYANNTIFVFFGDHGRSSPSVANMGLDHKLSNVGFHSAAWIYAPNSQIKPQVFDKNISLIDLLPTTLGLTGQAYINTTLGRDVFTLNEKDHYVLLLKRNTTGIYRVGFLGSHFYMEVAVDGSNGVLYDLNSQPLRKDVSSEHVTLFTKLKNEAIGLYFMSNYLLENNKPLKRDQYCSENPC